MNIKTLIISILLIFSTHSILLAQKQEKNRPLISAEQMPHYPGGDAELEKYITKSLAPFIDTTTDTIPWIIKVGFIVETDGSIAKPIILESILGKKANEITLSILQSMPKWIPGKQGDSIALVSVRLPVTYYISEKEKHIKTNMDEGYNLFMQGNYKEALERYGNVLAVDSTFGRTNLDYAATLIELTRYKEALEIFEKQYTSAPEKLNSSAYNNWGKCIQIHR